MHINHSTDNYAVGNKLRLNIGTNSAVQVHGSNYHVYHRSPHKTSSSKFTNKRNVSQQTVNLMMEEVPGTKTSLIKNFHGNGQYPNYINLNPIKYSYWYAL